VVKNRERMGISLPKELSEWLRAYSKQTMIPVSRIVEKALKEFKETHELESDS